MWVERLRARFGIVDILVRTIKRYSEDDAGSYAAALTYYAFFAVFPLLLFGAAILGYLTFGNQELKEEIFTEAVEAVPMIREALTPRGLRLIEANRRTYALAGIALAFYTGTGVIVALGHALDKIHHVEDDGNAIQKRIRALKWLAMLGFAAVGSLILTGIGGFASGLPAKALSYLGGFVVNVFIFTSAFKFLPAKRLRWKEVWVGAVIAAVGFELLKTLGAVYLARGASAREAAFGTLAGAATLLVVAYLISQVTLFAAEVNAAVTERRAMRSAPAATQTEEAR